jgi:hypothetical protein
VPGGWFDANRNASTTKRVPGIGSLCGGGVGADIQAAAGTGILCVCVVLVMWCVAMVVTHPHQLICGMTANAATALIQRANSGFWPRFREDVNLI